MQKINFRVVALCCVLFLLAPTAASPQVTLAAALLEVAEFAGGILVGAWIDDHTTSQEEAEVNRRLDDLQGSLKVIDETLQEHDSEFWSVRLRLTSLENRTELLEAQARQHHRDFSEAARVLRKIHGELEQHKETYQFLSGLRSQLQSTLEAEDPRKAKQLERECRKYASRIQDQGGLEGFLDELTSLMQDLSTQVRANTGEIRRLSGEVALLADDMGTAKEDIQLLQFTNSVLLTEQDERYDELLFRVHGSVANRVRVIELNGSSASPFSLFLYQCFRDAVRRCAGDGWVVFRGPLFEFEHIEPSLSLRLDVRECSHWSYPHQEALGIWRCSWRISGSGVPKQRTNRGTDPYSLGTNLRRSISDLVASDICPLLNNS